MAKIREQCDIAKHEAMDELANRMRDEHHRSLAHMQQQLEALTRELSDLQGVLAVCSSYSCAGNVSDVCPAIACRKIFGIYVLAIVFKH